MDDCVIQEIAAEDEGSRLERERLEEKVVSLRGLLDHLRLLDRHHLTGMRTEFEETILGRERLIFFQTYAA
jgi:hypothetical protein